MKTPQFVHQQSRRCCTPKKNRTNGLRQQCHVAVRDCPNLTFSVCRCGLATTVSSAVRLNPIGRCDGRCRHGNRRSTQLGRQHDHADDQRAIWHPQSSPTPGPGKDLPHHVRANPIDTSASFSRPTESPTTSRRAGFAALLRSAVSGITSCPLTIEALSSSRICLNGGRNALNVLARASLAGVSVRRGDVLEHNVQIGGN